MLPDGTIIDPPAPDDWAWKMRDEDNFLVDFEVGGQQLSGGGGNLDSRQWTYSYDAITNDVTVTPDGGTPTVLFTRAGITEIAGAFDQNMHPFVAFVENGQAKIWWYDPQVPGQTFKNLPADAENPRCCLDERRWQYIGVSDIIVAYNRGGNLYYRQQRDRFDNEYLWLAGSGRLKMIGMNKSFRLQCQVEHAPGSWDGTIKSIELRDAIRAFLRETGLPSHRLQLGDLRGIQTDGFILQNTYSVNTILTRMSESFFFDPVTVDGAIRFVKRGGPTVETVPEDDLIVEREDDRGLRLEATQADTMVVPRVLQIKYHDGTAKLGSGMQTSERPIDSDSQGIQTLTTPFVMSHSKARQVAAVNHLAGVESGKGQYEFALPDKYIYLTVGDPVFLMTPEKPVRARIVEEHVLDGYQRYKASAERASAYSVEPEPYPTPDITVIGDEPVGQTIPFVLDCPIIDDEHDQLGVYLALGTSSPRWPGALIEMSVDGGQNYIEQDVVQVSAVVGVVHASGGVHPRAYPDQHNNIRLTLMRERDVLNDASPAAMAMGANMAWVGGEMLQFGEVDDDSAGLVLSQLWRGRRYTDILPTFDDGTPFVRMDKARMRYYEVPRQWLSRTITVRATTLGQVVGGNSVRAQFQFTGQSQREFPVSRLHAWRSGGQLHVRWTGASRLRSGRSQWFTGYRVTVNGTAQTVQTEQIDVADPGGAVTVSVAQLNHFTGAGPARSITI